MSFIGRGDSSLLGRELGGVVKGLLRGVVTPESNFCRLAGRGVRSSTVVDLNAGGTSTGIVDQLTVVSGRNVTVAFCNALA